MFFNSGIAEKLCYLYCTLYFNVEVLLFFNLRIQKLATHGARNEIFLSSTITHTKKTQALFLTFLRTKKKMLAVGALKLVEIQFMANGWCVEGTAYVLKQMQKY